MKQNGIYRGEWAGCSDFNERREELTRVHESEELKALKEKLDAGWKAKVTGIKHKRPRIQKEKSPKKVVVSLGNVMAATLTLSWEDYQQRGSGLKVVMRIY